MEFVTGKAAVSSRRTIRIARILFGVICGLLALPFLFAGFRLGDAPMLWVVAAGCLLAAPLGWLLPLPEARAGVPLLTLGPTGITLYPAAQWSRRAKRVDLRWLQVERITLHKPPRTRPSIALMPTDLAARALNLRPPGWQATLLAGWTRPRLVMPTDSFDCPPEAVLEAIANAAAAAGRRPRIVPRWDGGATVLFDDGQDRPGARPGLAA